MENTFLYLQILEFLRFYNEKRDYNVNYEYDDQRHTGSVGTYYYIAPEILKSEPYNYKCDYSVLELLSIYLFLKQPHMVS